MSTRIITETDCDKCGKKNVTIKTIRIYTHRTPDPAGGPSEDSGKLIDLCVDCLYHWANMYVKKLVETENTAKVFEELKIDARLKSKLADW
jgi:hypothetical protein